jgi:hypothetical protein
MLVLQFNEQRAVGADTKKWFNLPRLRHKKEHLDTLWLRQLIEQFLTNKRTLLLPLLFGAKKVRVIANLPELDTLMVPLMGRIGATSSTARRSRRAGFSSLSSSAAACSAATPISLPSSVATAVAACTGMAPNSAASCGDTPSKAGGAVCAGGVAAEVAPVASSDAACDAVKRDASAAADA